MRRCWTMVAGTGVLAATVLGPGGMASGAPPAEEHCVLVVTGRAADGELLTDPIVCSGERSVALDRAGATPLLAADWTIGTHYDGAGWTGSSVSVVGADCTGGWLNLPGSWNDRISSTLNGCPTIRHHLHVNLSGASQTTGLPGGNLGATLNNEVSSIQYLP